MKIVMLCGKGDSSLYMYNGICREFPIAAYIEEEKQSVKRIVKRRIKKLGFFKVCNMILFQVLIPRLLHKTSRKRVKTIIKDYNLDNKAVPETIFHSVNSVNDKKTIEILKKINPGLVIVNGTRIISKKVLNSIDAMFINTHVGITPEYRGVHGGYWALINNDKENCGVTIHRVDQGIDTGGIIKQEIITPTEKDNFTTYPILQIAKAIEMMKEVLKEVFKGEVNAYKKQESISKLWYHPTFTGYIYNRIIRGVK